MQAGRKAYSPESMPTAITQVNFSTLSDNNKLKSDLTNLIILVFKSHSRDYRLKLSQTRSVLLPQILWRTDFNQSIVCTDITMSKVLCSILQITTNITKKKS